ncbi:MAG: hypothetical protein MH252_07190 [Thermosynechococcaceae cyanobacterium MS004]|nr:hypothetical protein [Thermosynechococcaceae cyanobacterium MS004]
MQYKILSANTENTPLAEAELEQQVNHYIQHGWEPIGGLSNYIYRDGLNNQHIVLYQAMIFRG